MTAMIVYRCPGCGVERQVDKRMTKARCFSVSHGCPGRKGKPTKFKKVDK